MEGVQLEVNLLEEKEASRARGEEKRAKELAGRLIAILPGGSTEKEFTVAAMEKWPNMSTDLHTAIILEIRNELEGEDAMSRAKVLELRIWLLKELRKCEGEEINKLKAPATYQLAKELGVDHVAYDTFRTQYFYPLKDQVREELGVEKPVKGRGKGGFKTLTRQKSDEKKAREKRAKAERKAEEFQATANEAGKGLAEDLTREMTKPGNSLLEQFEQKKTMADVDEHSTEVHEKAHQEVVKTLRYQHVPAPPSEGAGLGSIPGEASKPELPKFVLTIDVEGPAGELHYGITEEEAVTLEVYAPAIWGFGALMDFLNDIVRHEAGAKARGLGGLMADEEKPEKA